MAIGPGEIFCPDKESLELADFLEKLFDGRLRALTEWDGGSPVRLLIFSYATPTMAVQAELRRRYTREDGWSDVIFEPALSGGFWLTLKP